MKPHQRTTSNRRLTRQAQRGFTLLEVIVVVTIIALLAAIVAPKLLGNIGRSKHKIAKNEVAQIAQQVSVWCADQGVSAPPDDFELDMLVVNGYLREKDLLDPWDNPYIILIPGDANPDSFDIVTFGADGQPGGEGENEDITN